MIPAESKQTIMSSDTDLIDKVVSRCRNSVGLH